MKEQQFININSNTWRELENLTAKIEKRGIKSLPSDDIKSFLRMFRQSSHHLAYARTHYPQSSIIAYLNSLIGRCHSHIYAVKKVSPMALIKYITTIFPKLLKEWKTYIIASFLFFFAGFLISFLMVLYSPDNASMFLPKQYIDSVTNSQLGASQWNDALMSSQIMVNNIKVSLMAFVLGITLGAGTIYVLFQNGYILGSLAGLVYVYSDPVRFWSLILPHGVIELTAIFISGAAGLMIAKSLLIPGEYTRSHSLIDGAKKSVSLIWGVIFLLVIAGIIEGFFTPLNISYYTKLCFAGLTAVVLALYFSIPYTDKLKKLHTQHVR